MTELTGLGAARLQRGLHDGEFSALELTRSFLERIRRIDGELHAFLRLNPAAEEQAIEADRRLAAGRAEPLTGIPVAVKDNIHVAGLETTCASRLLAGFRPLRDATAVDRLRRAGAVFLGKTNMDEFAMGSSTENSAYGPTRNPWDKSRVPGGSSGGSAAAVAAGLAPLALGSDTGGSIRQPAAFCGVVGLKPTYGRISRSGLVAFGSSLDQIGPLAKEVADAALLLQALAGPDARDATSASNPVGDYLPSCERGVAGLRIGLPREYFGEGLDGEIAAALSSAARALEREGARLEEVSLPHTRFAVPTYYLIATAEASSNLARYDAVRYGWRERSASDLAEMYAGSRGTGFGREVLRRIMLGTYALSAGYYEQFYGKAQRVRTLLRQDFLDLFDKGVRLLLAPATPTTAFRLGEKVDDPLAMYLSDVYTVTANLAGLPGLVLPLGRARNGLPIGGQLIGPDFGEELLFQAGAVLERAFPASSPGPPERPPGSAVPAA